MKIEVYQPNDEYVDLSLPSEILEEYIREYRTDSTQAKQVITSWVNMQYLDNEGWNMPIQNTVHTYKTDDGECNVAYHYETGERPLNGEIAHFNVYFVKEYCARGDEGETLTFTQNELHFTVPFLHTHGTLMLMIQSMQCKIHELMEDHELFIGVEIWDFE